jgi:hypothetical protein
MRTVCTVCLIMMGCLVFSQEPPSLLPLPSQISVTGARIKLKAPLTVSVHGPGGDSVLVKAVDRALTTISRRTGMRKGAQRMQG